MTVYNENGSGGINLNGSAVEIYFSNEFGTGGIVINGFAAPVTYVSQGFGGIQTGGCSEYSFTVNLPHAYNIGDTVYNKLKANKGILRKHTIKEVRYADYISGAPYDMCRHCNYPPLYVDTFNAYHNEEDLTTYANALILIDAALVLKASLAERHALSC